MAVVRRPIEFGATAAALGMAEPRIAEYVVEYAAMCQPDQVEGVMRVKVVAEQAPDGTWKAPLRRWHIEKMFPFEGKWFFRGKHYQRKTDGSVDDAFVWFDLTTADAPVPRTGTLTASIKATPLFPAETPDPMTLPPEFPLEPLQWAALPARGSPVTSAVIAEVRAELVTERGPEEPPAAAAAAASGSTITSGLSVLSGVGSVLKKAGTRVGTGVASLLRKAGAAAAELIEGGAPPSDMALATLMAHQADLRTPFSGGAETELRTIHRGMLAHLQESFQRTGKIWVTAGCASEDPALSFGTGAGTSGMLGLHVLAYCARTHPQEMRELVSRHSALDDSSLRIVGSVNAIVWELADAVGIPAEDIATRKAGYFKYFEKLDAFYELVYATLRVLDSQWVTMEGHQTHFTEMLEQACGRALGWLNVGITDTAQLRRLVLEQEGLEL
jgi:hypothetical protein